MRAKCLVEGCERNRHGQGYCGPHYKRWIRYGDAVATTNYGLPFWDRVDKTGNCWIWTGYRDPQGYGRIYAAKYGLKHASLTHRVSWLLTYGYLDPDDCVLHRCDNPPCVRPDHLFLGTRADNTADAKEKSRLKGGPQPWESRTHGIRNARAKLTESQVVEMRQRALAGEHFTKLAEEYGISASRANGIILGNGWRHIWPYFDTSGDQWRPERIRRKKRTN